MFQHRALRKFHVTDGQHTCDQITRVQLHAITGSPNECWLHTCDACIITTWRLGLWALLVARNNYYLIFQCELHSQNNDVHYRQCSKPSSENRLDTRYCMVQTRSINHHVEGHPGVTSILLSSSISVTSQ